MSKTLLVAWREFLATVLTKGFILGILLPPVIMAGVFLLMPLLMNSAAPKTAGVIAVVDQSGGLVAPALAKSLSAEQFRLRQSQRLQKAQEKMREKGLNFPITGQQQAAAQAAIDAMAPTLSVEVLPADTDIEAAKKPILEARVREAEQANAGQRVALVVIPAASVIAAPPTPPTAPTAAAEPTDKKPYDSYQMFVAPKLDPEVQGDIADQVDRAIVDARLTAASLDPDRVRTLTTTPKTDTKVVTAEGERRDSAMATMMLPIGFLMLLWISVMVGGQGLLMSTVEEKSSRVMEVLLSAVSPMQLMVGKILGQMAVAALIMSLYAFTGIGALVFFSLGHELDPMLLICTPIYFIIAFFLMASMLAAIGSAVNDIREAQALMQPIMIVLIIPMILWLPISRNPNGIFAVACSFFPPISPFVMVVRLAGSEKIPFWQIPATILLGLASMAFMAWFTAKVFRIGVLMYGKPPNFRTLIKWVRMA